MVDFSESSYRFTDPIRYFKANDPIYYEVDNIPLKQLQENDLWLKDQLSKLEYNQVINNTNITNTTVGASRSSFLELQPYVKGTDNTVYVRSGRFIARINDAYNLRPLQLIERLFDETFVGKYKARTNRDNTLLSTLNSFKTLLAQNALGMNGLTERAFTRASQNLSNISQFLTNTPPGYSNSTQADTPQLPLPTVTGQTYIYNLITSSVTYKSYTPDAGFSNLVWQESAFIKRWRGIARTAVVDIPSELSIEIPEFDTEDFYFINEVGDRVRLDAATQRIDLLFIYAKPIDASAATISKFSNGSNVPSKIYTPQLGIVRGAGIGLNFNYQQSNSTVPLNSVNLTDSAGNQMMLPNISDQLSQTMGFSSVKGSFPSPDDLMNLAPTLADNVEDSNIALLGQSVLPIAYIVVKKTAQENAAGISILNSEDVIDIRPFFRTTELAYNERAGIAAAHPQVSIANPVATENYVDSISKSLSDRIEYVNSRIVTVTGTTGGGSTPATPTDPISRPVYNGIIRGGLSWGVESTLYNWVSTKNPNLSQNEKLDKLKDIFGYPSNLSMNADLPDWDMAYWARQQLNGTDEPGLYTNDYMNFFAANPEGYLAQNIPYAFYRAGNATAQTGRLFAGGEAGGDYVFTTKELTLNKSQVSWARSFTVNAMFHNCMPAPDAAGIFTTQQRDGDTIKIGIHVFWKADFYQPATGGGLFPQAQTSFPKTGWNNNKVRGWKGQATSANNVLSFHNCFAILHPELSKNLLQPGNQNNSIQTIYSGASEYGTAIYPTVRFEIVGHSLGMGESLNLSQNRSGTTVINLK